MTGQLTIAMDSMGGDFGVSVTIPSALKVLEAKPEVRFLVVGQEALIKQQLSLSHCSSELYSRLDVVHAEQVVQMDDQPSVALRTKKQSSMRICANLVKSGEAHAMVSAGNTGALMAISKFVLKTIEGISRPAIISTIPHTHGHFHMLDLGANVDCDVDMLEQFAIMGSVLSSTIDDISAPRVGVLNIGAEEIKGNEQVKLTHERLSTIAELNYIGYVEGDSIFSGLADVVVCDGFVGNVALKTAEGVAKMMGSMVKAEVKQNLPLKVLAAMALPFSRRLKKRLDPAQYNGATLIGLKGSVVKSHGGADVSAFTNALLLALEEADKGLPHLIGEKFSAIHGK